MTQFAFRHWLRFAAVVLLAVPFIHGCSGSRRVAEEAKPGRVKLARLDGGPSRAPQRKPSGKPLKVDPFLDSKVQQASASTTTRRARVTPVAGERAVPRRPPVKRRPTAKRVPTARPRQDGFVDDFDRELARLRASVEADRAAAAAKAAKGEPTNGTEQTFEWANEKPVETEPKPATEPAPTPVETEPAPTNDEPTISIEPAPESAAKADTEDETVGEPVSEAAVTIEPAPKDVMIVDTIEIRPRFRSASENRIVSRVPLTRTAPKAATRTPKPAPKPVQPQRKPIDTRLLKAAGVVQRSTVSAPPVDFENLRPTFRAAPTETATAPPKNASPVEAVDTDADGGNEAESVPTIQLVDAGPTIGLTAPKTADASTIETVEDASPTVATPADVAPQPLLVATTPAVDPSNVDSDATTPAPLLVPPTTVEEPIVIDDAPFDDEDPFASAAAMDDDPFANAEAMPLEGIEFEEPEPVSGNWFDSVLPVLGVLAVVAVILVSRRRRRHA